MLSKTDNGKYKVKSEKGFQRSDEQLEFMINSLGSNEMMKKSLAEVENWVAVQGQKLFKLMAEDFKKQQEKRQAEELS